VKAGSDDWRVRLAAAAEEDFRNIVRWTAEEFGAVQARTCARTLSLALEALVRGPMTIGARPRDAIGKGIYTLHVARHRRGRHFVVFRVAPDADGVIEVLRLLHDAVDLPRHLSRLETP
jgi:toxin ParE1/3/4